MKKLKGFTPLERNSSRNNNSLTGFNMPKKKKLEHSAFLTGFTLIELLVVIAIIALLLAILIPSLRKARNQARAILCQSYLKQWGTVLAIYTDNNQGRLFVHADGFKEFAYSSCMPKPKVNIYETTGFRTDRIMFCPMAVKTGSRPFSGNLIRGVEGSRFASYWLSLHDATLGSAFEAWEIPRFLRGSYGYSHALSERRLWRSQAGDTIGDQGRGLNVYSQKGQSNIPVLLDSASPYSIFLWEGQTPAPTEANETNCCINRHNGGVNSLFLDWSVRKVGLKELWKLKWHDDYNRNGPWTIAGGVKPEDWPEWMRGFKDY